MSSIHEEQFYFFLVCFFHQRLQRFSAKLFLLVDVCLFGNLFYFPPSDAFFFKKALTCGRDRLIPVNSSILA